MPVHIESLTSEIAALDRDLPLSPAQLERLVELVAARVEERLHRARESRRQSGIRPSALDDGRGAP